MIISKFSKEKNTFRLLFYGTSFALNNEQQAVDECSNIVTLNLILPHKSPYISVVSILPLFTEDQTLKVLNFDRVFFLFQTPKITTRKKQHIPSLQATYLCSSSIKSKPNICSFHHRHRLTFPPSVGRIL